MKKSSNSKKRKFSGMGTSTEKKIKKIVLSKDRDLGGAKRKSIDVTGNQSYSFSDNFFKINPSNSGVLASLARLISYKKSNCGCLYIDGDSLYFSSNLFPTPQEPKVCKYSQVEEILKKIQDAVTMEDDDEQSLKEKQSLKIEIIKTFLAKMIRQNKDQRASVIVENVASQEIDNTTSESDKIAVDLALSIREKVFDKEYEWSIESFYEMKNQVYYHISLNPKRVNSKTGFQNYITLLLCYLQDLSNFLRIIDYSSKSEGEWNYLSSDAKKRYENSSVQEEVNFSDEEFNITTNEVENYKFLSSFFKKNHSSPAERIKAIDQINSDQGEKNKKYFHCECRLFEHIIKCLDGKINKTSWSTFIEAVREKRIAISKPCCFHCHAFLISVQLSLDEQYCKKITEEKIDLNKKEAFTSEELEKIGINSFLEFDSNKITSMITCFLGNSARIFKWLSPSCYEEELGSLDQKTKIILRTFETLYECFEIKTGVLSFINETSESTEFLINRLPPEDHAKFGWLTF